MNKEIEQCDNIKCGVMLKDEDIKQEWRNEEVCGTPTMIVEVIGYVCHECGYEESY